jgi:hypothetical protein
MKFALAVFVALGLTMAWQASVVADNNKQEIMPQYTADSTATPIGTRIHRG